jgi:hypothetical protein
LDPRIILLQLKDLGLRIAHLKPAIIVNPRKDLQFVTSFEFQISLLHLLNLLIILIQLLQITLLIMEPKSIVRIIHHLA